jgi:plasmid stabilization system protein ParE
MSGKPPATLTSLRFVAKRWRITQRWADVDDVRPGLRRLEHGRRVVFYREGGNGDVLISRFLHQRMLPD